MAKMLQKFMATGRVGFIDDVKNVGSRKNPLSVMHFTVGVKASRRLADDEQEREGEKLWEAPSGDVFAQSTLWVRCTLWNAYAEAMANVLDVGMLVQVEGELAYDLSTGGPRTFAYEDGEPGAKFELNRVSVNILARPNGEVFEGDTPEAEIDEMMDDEEELEPEPVPDRIRTRARTQAAPAAPARTTPQASRRPGRVGAASPNGQSRTKATATRASNRRKEGRAPF